MIAEIMIITEKCDVLVRKLYRKEAQDFNAIKIFCKKIQEMKSGHHPPHFVEDGVRFFSIHRDSLFFVATSSHDVTPILITDFLNRMYHITKDLIGIVTEESVRANFLPVFEMLCEAMDGGCIQLASTEQLRPFIQSQPVTVVKTPSTPEEVASRIFGIDRGIAPSSASEKPALTSGHNSKELFVDVVEHLTAVINSEGRPQQVEVVGTVAVISHLPGQPMLRITLNDDLQICPPGCQPAFGASVRFQSCELHQNVDGEEFESKRALKMTHSAGKFAAMTYSVLPTTVNIPVRIDVRVEDIANSRDVSVTIRVILNVNTTALRVCLKFPVPSLVSSLSQTVKGPSEWLSLVEKERQVVWNIRNLTTAEPSQARLRLINHSSQAIAKNEIGPIAAEFEVSNVTLSGLQIRGLKVIDGSGKPKAVSRFVRYVTKSDSFTVLTS